MAVVYTQDFEGYSVSDDPSSSTKFASNLSYSVVSTPTQEGSRALELTSSGAIHDGYWVDSGHTDGNVDVRLALRAPDISRVRVGIIGRCHTNSGQEKGYVAMLRSGNTLRLAELRDHNETTLSTTSISTLSDDTWYWIKLSMGTDSNDDLKTRWWQDGSSEPGTWVHDTTDGSFAHTETGVGIYGFIESSDNALVDYVEVDDRTVASSSFVPRIIIY